MWHSSIQRRFEIAHAPAVWSPLERFQSLKPRELKGLKILQSHKQLPLQLRWSSSTRIHSFTHWRPFQFFTFDKFIESPVRCILRFVVPSSAAEESPEPSHATLSTCSLCSVLLLSAGPLEPNEGQNRDEEGETAEGAADNGANVGV